MRVIFCIAALLFSPLVGAPIKVGILHSLTGSLANNEKPVVDATLLAIKEINAQGGVLGRQIEPVIFDGKSDELTFARGAEQLITQDQVACLFGCWTSASRKNVKEVVEKYNHLLFYPVQYEGLEMSPNIVYTGAAPNQQLLPGVSWAFFHLGKRFFIVGSDYVFPRTASEIIKDVLRSLGGEIVGEEYIPLGSDQVLATVEKIAKTKPDVILNTINGDTNLAFFTALRSKGITPEKIPTLSFSLVPSQFMHLKVEAMIGDYGVWSYFQSIENPVNERFISAFHNAYSSVLRISDPMEAAYNGVYFWAAAVKKAGSIEPRAVIEKVKGSALNAPQGMIYIDGATQHTWKYVRIGKIRGNFSYEVIWSTDQAIRPIPFPQTRSTENWTQFLQTLYEGYGNKWAK